MTLPTSIKTPFWVPNRLGPVTTAWCGFKIMIIINHTYYQHWILRHLPLNPINNFHVLLVLLVGAYTHSIKPISLVFSSFSPKFLKSPSFLLNPKTSSNLNNVFINIITIEEIIKEEEQENQHGNHHGEQSEYLSESICTQSSNDLQGERNVVRLSGINPYHCCWKKVCPNGSFNSFWNSERY